MPNTGHVPSSYKAQWNAGARQPASDHAARSVGSSSPSDSIRQKYCSSCNTCRKSRVKCSGGQPCQRCAGSDTVSCVYSVSRRRGKRKATDELPFGGPVQYDMTNSLAMPSDWMWPSAALTFDSNASAALIHTDTFDPTLLPDLEYFTSEPPNLTDLFGPIKPPNLSKSIDTESPQGCPHSCFVTVQNVADNLASKTSEPEKTSLDKLLPIFQHASNSAARFLACTYCDNGCPRLMNLAMLHQRQANLLCEIAKGPADYLGNAADDTARVMLGDYQPSRGDDVTMKRLMLLGEARLVDSLVGDFHNKVQGFEDRDVAGTSKLSETGKINVRWLLDVSANLKKRLDCVKTVIGNPDWAANVAV